MSGRGSGRLAARLLCAAAISTLACRPAAAQTAPAPGSDPAELDPSAPLAPLPDLGVEWPDLNARDQAAAPVDAATPQPPAPVAAVDEEGGERRYSVAVEGLGTIGNADELLAAFREQSALEADRKQAANAAQIDRRSRADADLLAELLRSQGYYDAAVAPRTARAGDMLQVVLEAEPGQQ